LENCTPVPGGEAGSARKDESCPDLHEPVLFALFPGNPQTQIGSFKEAMERDLRKVRAVLSRVKTRLMSLPFALPSFDIAAHRLYQVLPALATTETV
jgi:hypothetical protein